MNKIEFLFELEKRLQALPDAERKQSLEYYFEIIDDRMDEGLSEEEAVAACGSVDTIAERIILDTPMTKLVKQKSKTRRRMQAWEIVLIVLGFPIWFSLAVAVFCVLLAISACLWVVVGCLFVVSAVCGGIVEAMAVMTVAMAVQGQFLPALFFLGCGFVCTGVAILFFLFGRWSGKAVAWLHKITFRGIKRCFIRKEAKA